MSVFEEATGKSIAVTFLTHSSQLNLKRLQILSMDTEKHFA